MELKYILKEVIDNYNLIEQPNKMRAYLFDYGAPRRDVNIITSVCKSSYFDEFTAKLNSGDNAFQKKKLISCVADEFGISKGYLINVVDAFEFALCGAISENVDIITEERTSFLTDDANPVISAEECKKSARMGDTYAQLVLAGYYEKGFGVEKNYEKAFHWYSLASQGSVEARFKMGLAYFNGIGIRKNLNEGFNIFVELAQTEPNLIAVDERFSETASEAKQACAKAQYMVAECYNDGIAVSRNNKEAIKWFKKAASYGLAAAELRLGMTYFQASERSRAFELFEKSANKKHPLALLIVGLFYGEGIIVDRDAAAATACFDEAYKLDPELRETMNELAGGKNGRSYSFKSMMDMLDEKISLYNTF